MSARWRDPASFRADPAAAPTNSPSRRQSAVLLVILLVGAAAVAVIAYVVRPDKARAFDLVHGSVFLADATAPVGIDLASGKPTVRLVDAVKEVSAPNVAQLSVQPLSDATLLLNTVSGEFNLVDQTGFVVKHNGGGVTLRPRQDHTQSVGYDATSTGGAPGAAYIQRTGPDGTDVFLVNETTVQTASGQTGPVKPRASYRSAESAPIGTGSAVSANGDLWLLLNATEGRATLTQLSVPSGSNTGVQLKRTDHGSTASNAALGMAKATKTGDPDAVGVASHAGIQVFVGGQRRAQVSFDQIRGVQQIVPTTNARGRLAFLVNAASGWRLVSVKPDGSDLRVSTALHGVASSARLAEPAQSDGALYTADLSNGALYRIDLDTGKASSLGRYPSQVGDPDDYRDMTVLGRGPRIIYNSPAHRSALAVFTDAGDTSLVIKKNLAVDVSVAGGAAALVQEQAGHRQTTKPTAAPKPGTAQKAYTPINTRIDCKSTSQRPHPPVLQPPQPGSRSAQLSWRYVPLDPQDCLPSTYLVNVKRVSGNAPSLEKASYTVDGQLSVTIGGLFPDTTYEVTVTAVLNEHSATSAPLTLRTGQEGPAAPTDVQVAATADGNWNVAWQSCGQVSQGCVAAGSWQVVPSYCDGRRLAATPATATQAADPTTKAQPPLTYQGSDALLGRGLQFVVIGTGTRGQVGAASKQSACVYSWTRPDVAAMRLHASNPASTLLGSSSSTNVTLDLGTNPVRAVGGIGARVTFTVTGGGRVQTKSVIFNGNVNTVSANFNAIRPGAIYTAGATVTPAHGAGAVAVPVVTVSTRADWPAVRIDAHCPATGLVTCTLTVALRGLASADADGEQFTFDGDAICGNVGKHLHKDAFDPAAGPIAVTEVDQRDGFVGNCVVTGRLSEASAAVPPLVFGGSVLTLPAEPVTLPGPTTLNAGAGDFTATWADSTVVIRYIGAGNQSVLATGWSESIVLPNGNTCKTVTQALGPDNGTTVQVPDACIAEHAGDSGSWTVAISYSDTVGNTPRGPLVRSISGSPPPPPPPPPVCAPSGFATVWGATLTDPISVSYTGSDPTAIAGCTNWTYQLVAADGTSVCPDSAASGPPPQTISYTGCATEPVAGWQVRISWHDTAGAGQHSDVTIPGDPPTA